MRLTKLAPAVCVLALVACSAPQGSEDPVVEPTETESSNPAPSPSPTETAPEVPTGETRTVSVRGGEAEIEVGPLAIDGDTAVLRLNVTAVDERLSESFNDPYIRGSGPSGVALLDADNGYVHHHGWTKGSAAFTAPVLGIDPGESHESFIAFEAPQTDDPVAVIPHGGFFPLDVVDLADTDYPTAEDLAEVPVSELTFPVSELRTYSEELEGNLRTREADDVTVVTVSADVLFDKDSAELSSAADDALERAAKKITGDGELSIVGHTDDVGTHEHNQKLSEDRARSVADSLEKITDLSAFDVVVEGRSYDEPAVDGTSEEARAENRRVEISFTPAQEDTPEESGSTEELPEPVGPVGAAGEEVTIVHERLSGDVSFGVTISRLYRVGNYLAGEVELTNHDEARQDFPSVFAIGPWDTRGDLNFGDSSSATRLTLADASILYYPLDYLTPERDYSARGGSTKSMGQIPRGLEPGESTIVTIVWPNISTDEATLESPWIPLYEDRPEQANRGGPPFRVTDIPIEDL